MSDPHGRPSPWRAIAAATALNAPLGSLYAFSVFLQPLEATLLGRLLLGEPFTGPTIVGGLMILGGVYLVTWPSRYSLAARSKPEGAT